MPEPDNNGDSNLMTLDIIENLIGEIEGKIKELKPNTNMDMLKSLEGYREEFKFHRQVFWRYPA